MASPFYKVYIEKNNREISEAVERFHYEDCTEEDSYLELVLSKEESMKYADDPDIAEGVWLNFQFGYIQGELSKLHRCKISDIKTRYADRVTLTIKCLDIGTSMRKDSNQVVWKNKTSVQIAKEIADKWGLRLESDSTTRVWDSVPQGNKSDMAFLQYLASREDTGNFVTYIRNDVLYFVNRKLKSDSTKTYTYNDGNGTVVSFEPEWRESTQDSSAIESKHTSVDQKSGKVVNTKVNNSTETSTGTLGENKLVFSGNFKYKRKDENKLKKSSAPAVSKPIVLPTKDSKEAENLANSKKKKATLKSLEATLVTEGEPNAVPNSVITVAGVAKNHSGNWFVTKVTHDISGSGYVTTHKLNKNGTNKGNATKSSGSDISKVKDANKTVGPKKAEDKVKVVTFDGMFRRK